MLLPMSESRPRRGSQLHFALMGRRQAASDSSKQPARIDRKISSLQSLTPSPYASFWSRPEHISLYRFKSIHSLWVEAVHHHSPLPLPSKPIQDPFCCQTCLAGGCWICRRCLRLPSAHLDCEKSVFNNSGLARSRFHDGFGKTTLALLTKPEADTEFDCLPRKWSSM
ncbi:hypothetical protein BDW72DRAFT_186327 [Aspergillus terricola var. indicus]